MAAVDRFVNPIPNPARYQKYNGVNLETLCMAAYQGDLEQLEVLLRKARLHCSRFVLLISCNIVLEYIVVYFSIDSCTIRIL